MNHYAIVIGVETFPALPLQDAIFAKADTTAIHGVLETLGIAEENRHLLVDASATKDEVQTHIDELCQSLTADDTLLFFYTGFAFSTDQQQYLACYDTQEETVAATSLAVAHLMASLEESACRRAAFFFDSRASGHQHLSNVQPLFADLADDEIEHQFAGIEQWVCLVASDPDEPSHYSKRIKHGIWAYHLVESIAGDAPLALDQGQLTATSLQAYLQAEVPRTLRQTYSNNRRQTPWMLASGSEEFLLADLNETLQQRRKETSATDPLGVEVSFSSTTTGRVKDLAGWKKTHHLPDRVNDATFEFVARLSAEELNAELDAVYDALKQTFGFTRRDLHTSSPDDGTGTIITPAFNYSVGIAPKPDRPNEVTWTRIVDSIRDADAVRSAEFAKVFDKKFTALTMTLPEPLDVEAFIDEVEAARNPDVKISYDRTATYCDLQIAGAAGDIRITADSLSIVHELPQTTSLLIDSFDAVQALIVGHSLA